MPVIIPTCLAANNPLMVAMRRRVEAAQPPSEAKRRRPLKPYMSGYMRPAPSRPGQLYLPGGMMMLRKLLSVNQVKAALDLWGLLKSNRYPEPYSNYDWLARKIVYGEIPKGSGLPITHMATFMILYWMGALDQLPDFIEGGVNDLELPLLTTKNTGDADADKNLPLCLRKSSEAHFKNFIELQWCFFAPVFATDPLD
ncbi:hypothetical protein N3K66_000307 [Trichothecium roseum]|uniref:Uncharacterized protein n=1 Tax=Trichothecium roseum TaxID=47278 RepID=A0ACC0VCC1_9HYPO|nr:hypothetical protein N3K66_000307 [Trichothecium roseum]